eukprot:TRINITY_DN8270_c0_g1_i1.p1 TRINITY_DN8270_c0_g1~~TRINITY_DN8270_c0_g1_i1.p1  ORF type:complete len:217 (+),score=77.76 TRINITY_DN8270_c0_g1_i1:72-653(+)
MAKPVSFPFSWEAGGVLEWIGRGYGTRDWLNPSDTGDVSVTLSQYKSGKPEDFVDLEPAGQQLCTSDAPFSWIQVELPVAVHPTHYRMSHSPKVQQRFLRNWALCVSYDGHDWRVLCQHNDDQTLEDSSKESLTGGWELKTPSGEFYPYFRVVVFENGTSSKTDQVAACCFELFGTVRHREWPPEQARMLGIA